MEEDKKIFIDEFYDKCKNGKLIENIPSDILQSFKDGEVIDDRYFHSAFNVYLWNIADMQNKKSMSVVFFFDSNPPTLITDDSLDSRVNTNLPGFTIYPNEPYGKGNFILKDGVRVHYVSSREHDVIKNLQGHYPDQFSYSINESREVKLILCISIDFSQMETTISFNNIPEGNIYIASFDSYSINKVLIHSFIDAGVSFTIADINSQMGVDIISLLTEEWDKFRSSLPSTQIDDSSAHRNISADVNI